MRRINVIQSLAIQKFYYFFSIFIQSNHVRCLCLVQLVIVTHSSHCHCIDGDWSMCILIESFNFRLFFFSLFMLVKYSIDGATALRAQQKK